MYDLGALQRLNMDGIDVTVKKATRDVLVAFYSTFSNVFYPKGWMVTAHGSSLEFTSGRDLDFVFLQLPNGESVIDDEGVIEVLSGLQFECYIDQPRGNWRGIVGVMREYVVDITLISASTKNN